MNKVTIKIDNAYCYKYWLFKYLISKRYKRQNTLYVEDIDDIYNYIENKVIIDGMYLHRPEVGWFNYNYEIAYYRIRYKVLNYNHNLSSLKDKKLNDPIIISNFKDIYKISNPNLGDVVRISDIDEKYIFDGNIWTCNLTDLNISLRDKIIDIFKEIEKDQLLIPWHNTEYINFDKQYFYKFKINNIEFGITYFYEFGNKEPNFHIINLFNNKNIFELSILSQKILYIDKDAFQNDDLSIKEFLVELRKNILSIPYGYNNNSTLFEILAQNIIYLIDDESSEYYNLNCTNLQIPHYSN